MGCGRTRRKNSVWPGQRDTGWKPELSHDPECRRCPDSLIANASDLSKGPNQRKHSDRSSCLSRFSIAPRQMGAAASVAGWRLIQPSAPSTAPLRRQLRPEIRPRMGCERWVRCHRGRYKSRSNCCFWEVWGLPSRRLLQPESPIRSAGIAGKEKD